MAYNIYAVFAEGSYLVATATHSEHGMDTATRVCSEMNVSPLGLAAIIPGEHTIAGNIFTLQDLKGHAK